MEWFKTGVAFVNTHALEIMFGLWVADKIAQRTPTKWDDKVVDAVKEIVNGAAKKFIPNSKDDNKG